jgi:hypothetical protein
MAFQISPGVNVSEVDLTTVVPSVLTTTGAFAGGFQWGPANKVKTIDSEISLVKVFGKPNSNTYTSFFSAASFLAYGNNLKTVRALGDNSFNAISDASGPDTVIANEDIYEESYLHNTDNENTFGAFAAKYAGALGNSLTISVIDSGANFATWNVNGVGVSSYFTGAPGTSDQAAAAGASDDEMHIIVIDTNGLFTGTRNTVLETFAYVSKGSDATDSLGNSNYYKNVLFNTSKYVYAMDPVDYDNTISTWGLPLNGTEYATLATEETIALVKGSDDQPTESNAQYGYSLFRNTEEIDISLVITGAATVATQQYVIDNLVEYRKDCVAFISPYSSDVINQAGDEADNISSWINTLSRSSSYVVADSGWKYMFDKYNNVYRWVPLNGDIAGLCVNTDNVRDPWFSPAGLNRGNLKNVVKLAWNPNKTFRDTIYSIGVNPVVSLTGSGTVLYGDKTLQTKPSAFDRINVRRLFIVLEKTIARAAKYSLFEFNDEFTRAQFVALVTPFLRDVQGRRGIYDFRVVCDSTNNTGEVIDSNRFVGDIYIKPARSINFIQLNFVAVRTGVDFTEVVGKF